MIDLEQGLVERRGVAVVLSARERGLLDVLVRADGAAVPREVLADTLGDVQSARAVDYAVRRLRTKLEADASAPRHLLSVHGVGYRFVIAHPVAAPTTIDAVPRIDVGNAWVDAETGQGAGPPPTAAAVRLTDKELAVLKMLFAAAPRAVDRQAIASEVWGRRASSARRYVDYVLHRLRAKLEPEPATPRFLVSAPGGAVALRGRPAAVSDAADAPKSGGLDQVDPSTALDADLTPLLGREQELATVSTLVLAHRLVTLHGPAGVGKTRLARAVAADALRSGATAEAWFCDLSDASGHDDVVQVVAQRLGVPKPSEGRLDDAVAHGLCARGPALLVLDNAEPLAAVVANLAARWLREAPALRLLVTSRERLRAAGEVVHAVPPLALTDAVALFLARRRDAGGRAGTDADNVHAARIVQELDCLPLALELAASRSALMPLDILLEQLTDRFRVLAGRRGGPERQRSMWAALAWSWAALSPAEQGGLVACATSVGGLGLDAVQGILPPNPDPLDVVETLHDTSWLVLLDRPGPPRLGLYQTLLDFVRRQRKDPSAVQRHAAWFAQAGRNHADRWQRTHDRTAMAWLTAEQDNLRRAVQQGATSAVVINALEALAVPWTRHGRLAELRALANGVTPQGPSERAAHAWVLAACHGRSLSTEARAALAHARAAAQAAGRGDLELKATIGLAQVATHDVTAPDVFTFTAAARRLAEALESPIGVADSLLAQGIAHQNRGDLAAARGHIEDALARLTAIGADDARAAALSILGRMHNLAFRPALARVALTESIELAVAVGHPGVQRGALGQLAITALQERAIDEAEALAEQAVRLAERLGARMALATHLDLFVLVAFERGDFAAALWAAERFRDVSDEVDYPMGRASGRSRVGLVLLAQGQPEAAAAALADAAARFAKMGLRDAAARSRRLSAVAIAAIEGPACIADDEDAQPTDPFDQLTRVWMAFEAGLVDRGVVRALAVAKRPELGLLGWVRAALAHRLELQTVSPCGPRSRSTSGSRRGR